jgi:hypothetical protein
MASTILGFAVHGVVMGTLRADASGWRVQAWRPPQIRQPTVFDAWDDTQVFPTEQALTEALDAYLGPEQVARLEQQSADKTAQQAHEGAIWQADAAARTFTGPRYKANRPLKETAKLIARDIQAAQAAGTLPRNRYRVTAQVRQTLVHPIIVIWMWGRDEATEVTLRDILSQYNCCEAVAPGRSCAHPDHGHFDWRVEEHNVFNAEQRRADMQALRRGEPSYDAITEQWRAERAKRYVQDTGRMPVDPYA